ncbi:DUF6207 family protein [Streptomyces sp. NPDC005227]|uniref:DUF6207 family protein n=1 Tax=unclassified Streptomyces TaxID=2593676 RepID=UPI00369F2E45
MAGPGGRPIAETAARANPPRHAKRWATAIAERTTRDVGQPGVRLRCYLDLRQPNAPATAPPTSV